MKLFALRTGVAGAVVLAAASHASAAVVPSFGTDLTQPGDPITSSPVGTNAAESVTELIDNVIGGQGTDADGSRNKFFVGGGTIVVTVDAANDVDRLGAIALTSGDDSPDRDPVSVSIAGSSTGAFTGEQTTLASNVTVPAFSGRTATQLVDLPDAMSAFDFYRITFATATPAAGSFQLGEFQLIAVPEPTSLALVGLAGLAMSRRRRRA